ncbi:MAG: PBECR3 domain-containing polyvalent protein [Candidatus Eutrophobiaceae bacterium]
MMWLAGSGGLARASRTAAERYIKRQNAPIAAAYKPWIEGVFNDQRMIRGRTATVGYIDMAVFAYFIKKEIKPPSNAAILLSDKQISHMLREKKKERGTAFSQDDIQRIPNIIASPEAILYDKEDPALLYVFSSQEKKRKGKLVVRIDRRATIQKAVNNEVRTGGLINPGDLPLSRYDRIQGNIE